MNRLEVQMKRQQQLAELLRVSAPKPLSPREEAIQILSDGLLELIIRRGIFWLANAPPKEAITSFRPFKISVRCTSTEAVVSRTGLLTGE